MKEEKNIVNKNNIRLYKNENAITLIALVITIIILIILAGISIKLIFGENGLIVKAQLSSFATEMQKIKENVVLKQNENALQIALGNITPLFENKLNLNDIELPDTLKQEVLYVREGYPSDKTTSDYNTADFDKIIQNQNNTASNNGDTIYIIDKETADGKENTYILDMKTYVVFKIKQTKIGGKIYHSYEVASLGKPGSTSNENVKDLIEDKESKVVKVKGVYYYSPNMKGFSKNETYIELYDSTKKDFTEVKLANANLDTINKDNTWHDYGSQIWANVKTTGNNLEAWWVWIPRYAYKINNTSTEPPIDVIYVGLDNKPLDPSYNGVLPDGYEVHSGFTTDKELYGIWMSKYEPSNNQNYTATSSECYAPDMSGFDSNFTYIELYNASDNSFEDRLLANTDLATINNNKTWYDYKNQIWANVKTTANGLEAWWVWIPRYAYQITNGITEANIIFVGLDNKPIDKATYGNDLPAGYTVHPAFTPSGNDGSKNLKGIWMSKYEPSWENDVDTSKVGKKPDNSSFINSVNDGHTHDTLGYGTSLRYVTSSTHWCDAWTSGGTDCNNYGYYRYCSKCGTKLRYYWCEVHLDKNKAGRVAIDDSSIDTDKIVTH